MTSRLKRHGTMAAFWNERGASMSELRRDPARRPPAATLTGDVAVQIEDIAHRWERAFHNHRQVDDTERSG
jgi:hypothetical protein